MEVEPRRSGREAAPEPAPDPAPVRLSLTEYAEAGKRAARGALDDNLPMIASALAYGTFIAIPSSLLVLTGAFTLVASRDDILTVTERLGEIVPAEAVTLLQDSLERLDAQPGSSILMIVVGFLVALWSTTGAMTTFMTAMNTVHGADESRGFVRRRAVALALVAVAVTAFVAVFGLLVLGPYLAGLVADLVGDWAGWAWWAGQWPVLLLVLLATFAAMLRLAPNVRRRRWRLVSAGAVFAMVVWLASSALFAVYTSRFGSYNKAWGSLASVIVMLTWLWISGLALLLGAEIDAEIERGRRTRGAGTRAARSPAEPTPVAPGRGSPG